MSRIDDKYLDSVFYIYPNEYSAHNGENIGACGFFASIQSNVFDKWLYFYAVTNKHAIIQCNTPVIRINTSDGGFEVLITDKNSWEYHPYGDDLAITSLNLKIDFQKHKILGVSKNIFATLEMLDQFHLGPGDITFMIGRLINHEGKQRNTPSVRFGNIAMMPLEPVKMEDGTLQEAFLVEQNSLPGYSGSPVFWEIPDFARRPDSNVLQAKQFRGLLGIDAGHLTPRFHV